MDNKMMMDDSEKTAIFEAVSISFDEMCPPDHSGVEWIRDFTYHCISLLQKLCQQFTSEHSDYILLQINLRVRFLLGSRIEELLELYGIKLIGTWFSLAERKSSKDEIRRHLIALQSLKWTDLFKLYYIYTTF